MIGMVIVESMGQVIPGWPVQPLNFGLMRPKALLPLLFACTIISSQAQDRGFGLGVMIGDPTGLSGKLWTGNDRALGFGLAWGPWHSGYLHAHADLLFHNMDIFKVSVGRLPLYYGPGLRLQSWNGGRYWNRGRYVDHPGTYVTLGVRFPVGLVYLVDNAPVDIFLEAAPTLDLLPGTYLNFDGGLGVRYYFN